MARALVTGANGTVGGAVAAALEARGHEVVRWNRAEVDPTDEDAVRAHVVRVNPDWLFHIALGTESWTGTLARATAHTPTRLLYTSTTMVFDKSPNGPYDIDDAPNALDDYGQSKRRGEIAVRANDATAIIVRFGWQIGHGRGGNQLVESLAQMMEKDGVVKASTAWTPATSFLDDTANAAITLMERGIPGTYHIDSNAHCRLTFAQIVRALNDKHGLGLNIEETEDYAHDQRMPDARLALPRLSVRLGLDVADPGSPWL